MCVIIYRENCDKMFINKHKKYERGTIWACQSSTVNIIVNCKKFNKENKENDPEIICNWITLKEN